MTVLRRRVFTSDIENLDGPIRWLNDHRLDGKQIADVLVISRNRVNVRLTRMRQGAMSRRAESVIRALDNRLLGVNSQFDFRPRDFNPPGPPSLSVERHESRVRTYRADFWKGVPHLRGTLELGHMLRDLAAEASDNIPAHRVRAAVNQLEAETYLHCGYAHSALKFGLEAFGIWEFIYKWTGKASDLSQLAKAVLVISNSFISRRDFSRAQQWLEVARQAFAETSGSGRSHPDPEYLRQLASVQRGFADIESARKNLRLAGEVLPYTVPDANQQAIADMSDRVLNALAPVPRWDESQLLRQSALRLYPPYDSHRASNVIWTAATGLLTDSPGIQAEALDQLAAFKFEVDGFGRQSTGMHLLSLTPRVPVNLRREWIFFAASYNAFQNK